MKIPGVFCVPCERAIFEFLGAVMHVGFNQYRLNETPTHSLKELQRPLRV